jgi:hypothetical protein
MFFFLLCLYGFFLLPLQLSLLKLILTVPIFFLNDLHQEGSLWAHSFLISCLNFNFLYLLLICISLPNGVFRDLRGLILDDRYVLYVLEDDTERALAFGDLSTQNQTTNSLPFSVSQSNNISFEIGMFEHIHWSSGALSGSSSGSS